MKLKLKQVKLN